MILYRVGKLAPNPIHSTKGFDKYVPGRGYYRAVSSQNGDKFVTCPPPPQSLNGSRVVFKFCLDVSSLKSKGLMGNPTRVNTEDETHLGLQQARGRINPWWSLWFHWVYMVDSTANVNRLGKESLV